MQLDSFDKKLDILTRNNTNILDNIKSFCSAIQCILTSTRDVVFNAKVSIGTPWVVAGCEDNTTHGLYLADHTGDGWSGHDAILTNHQMTNLKEGRGAQINTHMACRKTSSEYGTA